MPKWVVVLVISLSLAACGTYVPQHQEFWAGPDATSARIFAISDQVKCELGRGLARASLREPWLLGWGTLVTLTLDTSEKSAVMPGATITQPLYPAFLRFPGLDPTAVGQQFGLSLGGEASSKASNKGVITFFVKNAELATKYIARLKDPPPQGNDCQYPGKGGTGFLFTSSDLRLDDWIYSAVNLEAGDAVKFSGGTADQKFSIAQTIAFDIVTSGSVTPTWKLVRVSSVDTSPFASVSRTRNQTVDVVMGPIAGQGTLQPTAQFQYIANLFRNAVRQP